MQQTKRDKRYLINTSFCNNWQTRKSHAVLSDFALRFHLLWYLLTWKLMVSKQLTSSWFWLMFWLTSWQITVMTRT